MAFGQLAGAIQNAVQPQMVLEIMMPLLVAMIVIPAAMVDYKEHRIPNFLSLSGWFVGPVLYFLSLGIDGLIESITGFVILFVLAFPLWLIKWMGAGDVKLMAGIGAMIGGARAPYVYLGIVITGLIIALMLILLRRQFRLRANRMLAAIGLTVMSQSAVSPVDDKQPPIILPYAIPIAFGTLLSLLLLMMKDVT